MSLPRYPTYKPSGVAWLGAVPGHWDVRRFKSLVAESKNGIWGDEPQGDDSDIVCVRVADFDRLGLRVRLSDPTIRSVTPREREGRLLVRGDLLLEKSGGGEGQLVGCVVLYDHNVPAVCSNFVARVRLVAGANPSYWTYVFASTYAVRLNYCSVRQTSGIQNLDQAEYLNELAPVPPLAEQEAIVVFLDRETARLDALVTEQQRLIVLLKEKRQAVISHAVTRGLNPDAPLKPSGVEWLGDVPAHWEVKPLSRISVGRCDGPFGSGLKSEHYEDSGARVIRLQNIRVDGFDDTDSAFVSMSYYQTELSSHDVISGDVLVAGLGDDNHPVGRACVAPVGIEPALVKADCFRFRLELSLADPPFVATALSASARFAAGTLASGTTRSRIPLSLMAIRRLGLPPLSEQRSIMKFLDRETSAVDALIAEAERAIALLGERRAALIAAVVTGQVDVRGVAAAEGV